MNTAFSKEAPELTGFLSKVNVPRAQMDETLAHMESSGDDSAKWRNGS
ncbi:substrate binding domain of ABC-type glycine betaine transport system family protein [Bordetella holmesii 70147]|nr:substrate binding domain of ABC-type glycine betaine transport system family protein [Bordetella holmesii 70147]